MPYKRLLALAAALLLLLTAACSEKYNLSTPIGAFDMTVQISDAYETIRPSEGNQLVVVQLEPKSPGVTEQMMRDYFRQDGEYKGAVAECGDGEYTVSSMQFVDGENGKYCVILFEVPKQLTESGKIALKLPKEE